jgi:transcriptional regulator with XRE-family HTH domain
MPTDVVAQQIALYGEPLSQRFGRVLAAYRIPQSRLAAVLGLSAPMLSQLAGGHRVKISNPAVLGRLLRLEELARAPAFGSGDPARLQTALDAVAASSPQLSTEQSIPANGAPDDVVTHLARVATAAELQRAADAVPSTALERLLRTAARAAG